MKMPGGPEGNLSFNQANQASQFRFMAGQPEVNAVAWQDVTLTELAREGSLNRDEYVALSGRQNELARLSGELAADGAIDEYERARLATLRTGFQEELARYRVGDEHPLAGGQTQDRQAAFLYDQIAAGRLTREQALSLRMQMSGSNFANGREQADGLSLPRRTANAEERLGQVWASLGSGEAREPLPPAAPPRHFAFPKLELPGGA